MVFSITGANSFIGRTMVRLLASNNGNEVVAVVRRGKKTEELFSQYKNVNVVECDLEDYGLLGTLAGSGDVFINYAWNGTRGETRMDYELQKNNYNSSVAAARSMIDNGYTVLVSAGSQAEYGQIDGEITEETTPEPNTAYGKYKLQTFDVLSDIANNSKISFYEPRYFSLYGPGDYDKTLIMSCIRKMMHNDDVILNPCTQLWDYLYVDDACYALIGLIENKAPSGAYNFASGCSKPLREYVLEIKQSLGSNSRIQFDDPDGYKGLIINLQPKIDKLLNAATGWKPQTSFDEGIKAILKEISGTAV